jgi:hypothetical protein
LNSDLGEGNEGGFLFPLVLHPVIIEFYFFAHPIA